ncbi:PilZ domain-containing protein [Sphingomonas sp. ID1715]|uniref:PilZ domain-containing protein n=1 Tax=Sphingomonas sp. ID1715 TaxID=1656898 RepID=UPI001C2B948C|nr:PilZ domain-containing protein [Sphingomonas sp. ID1715]
MRWCRGGKIGFHLEDALAIFGLTDDIDSGYAEHHQIRDRRQTVHLPASIVLVATPVPVTVRDISQTGMRIEGPVAVDTESTLLIKLRDRPLLLGTVRWASGAKAGLQIAERIAVLKLVYHYD